LKNLKSAPIQETFTTDQPFLEVESTKSGVRGVKKSSPNPSLQKAFGRGFFAR
jgi:hypothetical protein